MKATGQHDALVLSAHGNRGVARRDNGELIAFHFRRRLGRPLPGDRVSIDEHKALCDIAERRNSFGRGDERGRKRHIAANLDRLVIVIAPEPAPSRDLLHRYLAAAEIAGIAAVIVLNKRDLPVPDQLPFDELEDLQAIGYRLLHTRCLPPLELDELPALLSSGTSLLAGQSGVGKSSLLNTLIPDLELHTRALSRVTGKGTHTTTAATLYPLPSGSHVIDTPGVWEYGLWSMEMSTLQRGFPEIHAHAVGCRFRDCSHVSEPGCAVAEAVAAGDIAVSRLAAWRRLLAEQRRLKR